MKIYSLSVWVRNLIGNKYVLLHSDQIEARDSFSAAEQITDLLGIDSQLWQFNPANQSTSRPLFVVRNDTIV